MGASMIWARAESTQRARSHANRYKMRWVCEELRISINAYHSFTSRLSTFFFLLWSTLPSPPLSLTSVLLQVSTRQVSRPSSFPPRFRHSPYSFLSPFFEIPDSTPQRLTNIVSINSKDGVAIRELFSPKHRDFSEGCWCIHGKRCQW